MTTATSRDDWCYVHGQHEPIPETGAYRVCIECNHCYVTRRELEDRYLERAVEYKLPEDAQFPKDADEIAFCQECFHDF